MFASRLFLALGAKEDAVVTLTKEIMKRKADLGKESISKLSPLPKEPEKRKGDAADTQSPEQRQNAQTAVSESEGGSQTPAEENHVKAEIFSQNYQLKEMQCNHDKPSEKESTFTDEHTVQSKESFDKKLVLNEKNAEDEKASNSSYSQCEITQDEDVTFKELVDFTISVAKVCFIHIFQLIY